MPSSTTISGAPVAAVQQIARRRTARDPRDLGDHALVHAAARGAIELRRRRASHRHAPRARPSATISRRAAARRDRRRAARCTRPARSASSDRVDAVDQHSVHRVLGLPAVLSAQRQRSRQARPARSRQPDDRRDARAAPAGPRRDRWPARRDRAPAPRPRRSARRGSDGTAPCPSARSLAFTSFAAARNRSRSSRGAVAQRLGERARPRRARRRPTSPSRTPASPSAASGSIVEQEREPRRHLVEPIDRRRRNRHDRRQKRERRSASGAMRDAAPRRNGTRQRGQPRRRRPAFR